MSLRIIVPALTIGLAAVHVPAKMPFGQLNRIRLVERQPHTIAAIDGLLERRTARQRGVKQTRNDVTESDESVTDE